MGPRSTSRSTSPPAGGTGDDLVVGVVRAPHGLRGEVKVESRTDVATRFRKGSRLLCEGVGDVVIASVRGPTDVPIVRFEGYHTRADADRVRGRALRVTREDSRRATKGSYLWADLVGLRAETPDGTVLGTVREVLRAGAADVLLIRADDSREELLLPAIASVVRDVDIPGGRVVVVPQEVLE